MGEITKVRRMAKLKVPSRPFRFTSSKPGEANLVEDEKIKFLATCIVSQQRAGFGDVIDLREGRCPDCKAIGFNTGWGYFAYTCGAEILSDGEEGKQCGGLG